MLKRLIVFILLVLLYGCTDEQIINAPVEAEGYAIIITDLPEAISAFEGAHREAVFVVMVKTMDDLAAVGKTVKLSVLLGEGEVSPAQAVTDEAGRVQAVYSVLLPHGKKAAQILAYVEGYTTTASIALYGSNRPAAIRQPERVSVWVDEAASEFVPIDVAVTDSGGVGIPDVNLRVRLKQFDEQTETFGILSPVQPTDADGRTRLTFHTEGIAGKVIVRCEIDDSDILLNDVYAETEISVISRSTPDSRLSVIAECSVLTPHPDSLGVTLITATLCDEKGRPIPNQTIEFSVDLGTIDSIASTNSQGTATVQFNNNYEYGTATIVACAPELDLDAGCCIEIRNPYTGDYTLILNTDRGMIYADNGETSANLTAVLKDQDGQCVSGENIVFTSNHGVVGSPVLTDEMGRAFTTFTDVGLPSLNDDDEPDSAVVTAAFTVKDLTASVNIMIHECSDVDRIDLFANAGSIPYAGDSTLVQARCYLPYGAPAPNGTVVHFEAVQGTFSERTVTISTDDGIAETYYLPQGLPGRDTLTAYVQTINESVTSNEVLIILEYLPPSITRLTAEPTELVIGDPASFSIITLTILDRLENPVRPGYYISFNTTLGTITSSAISDANGEAIVSLTPRRETGVAIVTAGSDTVCVSFISGRPHSIELTADPTEIWVTGGPWITSTLSATVRDRNENLVIQPVWIVFELINEPPPPAGCTFLPGMQTFASQTSNGVAVASLNPGEQIGGKLIRASTWPDSANDPELMIATINNDVAVVSGPPFQLDIDVNDHGIDAGGGAWRIEVSARVWDLHRNPVTETNPVMFTVDPEFANISLGHTGNVGRNGQSFPGLAFTELVYHSEYTFRSIEISGEVQTEQGQIRGFCNHILPLQQGSLTLHADPGNWMFDEDNDEAEIRCWAVLTDGHLMRIDNAPVLFTSSRGRFSWLDSLNDRLVEFFPDPARRLTGLNDLHNDEEAGTATVFLCGTEDTFFLDGDRLEQTVNIDARLDGLEVIAEPVSVILTRRE